MAPRQYQLFRMRLAFEHDCFFSDQNLDIRFNGRESKISLGVTGLCQKLLPALGEIEAFDQNVHDELKNLTPNIFLPLITSGSIFVSKFNTRNATNCETFPYKWCLAENNFNHECFDPSEENSVLLAFKYFELKTYWRTVDKKVKFCL